MSRKTLHLGVRQAGFTISGWRQQWCRHGAARQRRPHSVRAELRSAGFTIIEVMIATTVFSTVLLVITYGVVHFTHGYYKGVTVSTTQANAQRVLNTMAQAVQFSSSDVIPTPAATVPSRVQPENYAFCADGKIFRFTLYTQFTGGSPARDNWGVNEQNNSDPTTCDSRKATGSGQELLDPGMRIAKLAVQPVGSNGLWSVALTVASGADDQLGLNPLKVLSVDSPACQSQNAEQFCSVVTYQTTVQRRLNQ